MNRYQRHINLSEIGLEGQAKLSEAKVLVIGAGGLGCPLLQYLTAAGVGQIGIVDHDQIEVSNLQRQILFPTAAIGQNKAKVAQQVLSALNPSIKIVAHQEQLEPHNCERLFKNYDIIVDATDNFSARYLISDACVVFDKPLVYGAIYKFEGQVSVLNYKDGPSYRCLFPKPPKSGSIPNCEETGVLGVLPGIIGCLQANEVLKLILGLGNLLSGTLLCYNALNNTTSKLTIQPNIKELKRVKDRGTAFEYYKENSFCSSVPELSIEDLNTKDIQYIDVRELDEEPRISNDNIVEIPLRTLKNQLDKLSKEKKTVVFCKTSIRAQHAVSLLQNHHFNNCYSLKEGALALQTYLKNNS